MKSDAPAPLRKEDLGWGIAETVRSPLLVLDEAFRVLTANPAFYSTYGVSEGEVVGKPLFEIAGGQWDDPLLHDLLRTVLPEHTEVRDLEVRATLKGLGPRVMLINARQIRVETVKKELILFSLQDVTEREALHEELARYTGRLERSNRDLEDFAHAASHDLQEPLRKISTYVDRLSAKLTDTDVGDDERRYLERMHEAVGRLRKRIDDLLQLSRVARAEPELQRVELGDLVDDVLADLDVAIESAGATVEVEPLPAVDADPSLLRLVFQNLLSNALKFHVEGQAPVVRISAGPAGEGGEDSGVRLMVEDDGIGFDAEYAERIFKPFERLHGARVYEGSGVGLAIVRRIMDHHDGTVSAEPRAEGGSRFILHLPTPSSERIPR